MTVIAEAISGGILTLNAAERSQTMIAVAAPAAPAAVTFLTGNADGERACVFALIGNLLYPTGTGTGSCEIFSVTGTVGTCTLAPVRLAGRLAAAAFSY